MKTPVLFVLLAFALLASGCLQPEAAPSPSPSPTAEPSFNLPTPTPQEPSPSPSIAPRATPLVTVIPNVIVPKAYNSTSCVNETCKNPLERCKQDFNLKPAACCKPDYCLWEGVCWGKFDNFFNMDDEFLYYCINGSWTPVIKQN